MYDDSMWKFIESHLYDVYILHVASVKELHKIMCKKLLKLSPQSYKAQQSYQSNDPLCNSYLYIY